MPPPPADDPPFGWKLDAPFEKPDEALLAFAACLIVGFLFLLAGILIMVALAAAGAYLTGKHLLELAEDGQEHRRLSTRHVDGRVLDAGGGQVDVVVDRGTAVYPSPGDRCRLYLLDET